MTEEPAEGKNLFEQVREGSSEKRTQIAGWLEDAPPELRARTLGPASTSI